MASDKKRRKAAKLAGKKLGPRTGPFRHPDGDRRRRGGPNVDQAIKDKKARQTFQGVPEPDGPSGA